MAKKFIILIVSGLCVLGGCLIINEYRELYKYTYAKNDYNKELELIRNNYQITDAIHLVKQVELTNTDIAKLYVDNNDNLIFSLSEKSKDPERFYIKDMVSSTNQVDELHNYEYIKNDEKTIIIYGYNKSYKKCMVNDKEIEFYPSAYMLKYINIQKDEVVEDIKYL